jgi:hypothetical protein
LPAAGWRLASALLDCRPGRRGEPTFNKLFGTELYSNRAVLESTAWRPRTRLVHVVKDMMATGQERE